MKRFAKLGIVAAALAAAWGSAWADINVGVVLSATGPAASLGIPEKNTIALMPQTIGGQKVFRYRTEKQIRISCSFRLFV